MVLHFVQLLSLHSWECERSYSSRSASPSTHRECERSCSSRSASPSTHAGGPRLYS